MSYAAGQARILALVIACDDFNATNTSETDWKILNQGISDHYAILRPAGFSIEWIAASTYTVHWRTMLEVWQRYTDEGTTQTNLYGYVASVLPVMASPHGGDDSMSDLTVRAADDPKEMWTAEGGPKWLKWELEVMWDEQTTVTFTG